MRADDFFQSAKHVFAVAFSSRISRLHSSKERQALPAVALTTDTSILTAIGNDYEFDVAFRRQVEALVRGATVIGFVGGQGGQLCKTANLCLCVEGVDSTVSF